ncbi:putative RNA recognition motif domain, nucleotide-binding alpha-beta plait domain superfamily [Helianthus annuus]|nr:putative RNA recognition motif domain, nucleotide-binding alpha-beta plait domain superfamily [Helianthus annuus]
MGGRSYSPSPPRGGRYARRGRSPSPRVAMVVVVAVEEISLQVSWFVIFVLIAGMPEDLRRPFGEFGPLKDIYLPRDYYSGEPRGFGFVQFVDPADAAEAKYQMDGQVFQGRELTVVFAEENRKKPADMRSRERRGGSRYSDRRRSPPRRHSPPPRYARSRSRSREYSPPPKRRHQSRSVSPRGKRYSRERSYSRSPVRVRSPPYNGGSRSPSRSPIRDRSPPPYNNGSRSPSRSPEREEQSPRGRSPIRSPSRSRSRSPDPREYARAKPKRDASLSP